MCNTLKTENVARAVYPPHIADHKGSALPFVLSSSCNKSVFISIFYYLASRIMHLVLCIQNDLLYLFIVC